MTVILTIRLMNMAGKAPVAQFIQFLLQMYIRHDLWPAYSVPGFLWEWVASFANVKWLFDENTFQVGWVLVLKLYILQTRGKIQSVFQGNSYQIWLVKSVNGLHCGLSKALNPGFWRWKPQALTICNISPSALCLIKCFR